VAQIKAISANLEAVVRFFMGIRDRTQGQKLTVMRKRLYVV